jgi:hypothetical protein
MPDLSPLGRRTNVKRGAVVDIDVFNGEDVAIPEASTPTEDVLPAEDAAPAAPAPIIPQWAAAAAVAGVFEVAAKARGPHWSITDEQRDAIAEPLTGELDDLLHDLPFLGDVTEHLSERRLQLIAATGAVLAPRLWRDAQLAREHRESLTRRTSGTGDRTPVPIRPAEVAYTQPPAPPGAEIAMPQAGSMAEALASRTPPSGQF